MENTPQNKAIAFILLTQGCKILYISQDFKLRLFIEIINIASASHTPFFFLHGVF
jgi:hypothetical protein